MLKGSKPGERRGGRKTATKNRRTILTDRILAAADEGQASTLRDLLVRLIVDEALPADTRMVLTQNPWLAMEHPAQLTGWPRWARSRARKSAEPSLPPGAAKQRTAAELGALLVIIGDATALEKVRRKAGYTIAESLLPKKPVPKRTGALPDEYGLIIDRELAREYGRLTSQVHDLEKNPARVIPVNAEKIGKLKKRMAKIVARIGCCCPSRYGYPQAEKDAMRFAELAEMEATTRGLNQAERAEQAHLRLRLRCFHNGPEQVCRNRRQELEKLEEKATLSRKEAHELEVLRRLYPPFPPKERTPEQEDDFLLGRYHPFRDKEPEVDGNFYAPVKFPATYFSNPAYFPYGDCPDWPETQEEWNRRVAERMVEYHARLHTDRPMRLAYAMSAVPIPFEPEDPPQPRRDESGGPPKNEGDHTIPS